MRPDVAPPAALGPGGRGRKTPPAGRSTAQARTGQPGAGPARARARPAARGPRGSGCWAGLSRLSRPGLRPAPTGPASTRHGTTPTGLTGPLGGHEGPERRASHLIPAWARPRRRLGGGGGDEPRDGPTGSQPHGTEPDAHVGVAMKSDHDRKSGIRTGPFCEGGAGRCFPQVAPGSQVSRVMFQGDKAREAPGAARWARDPPLMTPRPQLSPDTRQAAEPSGLAIPRQNVPSVSAACFSRMSLCIFWGELGKEAGGAGTHGTV